MQTKNRILGVVNGAINLAPGFDGDNVVSRAPSRPNPNNMVTAALTGGGAGGGASMSVNGFWASNYQYMMTGIIPADPNLIDTSTLALMYRDMYLFDNTAGSAVDIQSHFPYSDWELRGLNDKELLPFQETLDRLNIRQMMPLISVAHLTDGFFCGSLIFDPRNKQFIDTLIHDALSCAVTPSPFFNIDPIVKVRVGPATQQFMHDTSEYAQRYLESMPRSFIDMLKAGAFTLDPVTTLFIPRRSTTDRAYTSYLHRILPMYLIEKTLFRGTLTEAQRRQRAMTHLTAGDDKWTPTGEELNALVRAFQQAEFDPLGGWVSTRNAVQAVDIRPGGDFWKWTDMADTLVPYKLRALGISEAFMEGDTSYAAAESAYSTFLETQNSFRGDMTERIFYSKIFPLVAVTNNLYRDPKHKASAGRIVDFLFNKANRANLKIPQLHWHKELEVKGEENMMDMLEMVSEKGVPVPLKMWMAAAKVDPDALNRDLKEDGEYRRLLQKMTGKDTSFQAEQEQTMKQWQGDTDEFDYHPDQERNRGGIEEAPEPELRALLQRAGSRNTTESMSFNNRGYRKPLLARDHDSGDSWELTKSGQIRHVPSAVMPERRVRSNNQIYSIAKRADRDPNYRMELKKRNMEKTGRTKLDT
jgi:hypothetical protein